ncbi:MAG: hypothetical protein LBB74_09185 [Chitinispirillales bacterium]|jgi:hypothetical protein|nr:hypothetical protein [Chitinispirillales bacterium]
MSISRRNNRALNRVLREAVRARTRAEHIPGESVKPAAPAYTFCADIPERYNDSYVRAIPKDPQNTFVYWELRKGHADGSLLADRGTAHVENGEAVRIGEQLSESRRRHAEAEAENNARAAAPIPVNDDSGGNTGRYDRSKERPRDDFQQPRYNRENYSQTGWDNRERHNRPDDGPIHRHNHADDTVKSGLAARVAADTARHPPKANGDDEFRAGTDNGGRYRRDERAADILRIVNTHRLFDDSFEPRNNYHAVNRGGGEQYRLHDGHQRRLYCLADNRYIWNDGAGYAQCRRNDDSAAFSEMLAALIARCNQYISDCRQSGGGQLARAMSSGLLCGVNAEKLT